MRSDEERIMMLHRKARRLYSRRKVSLWSGISVCLLAALITLITGIGLPFQSIASNGFAGSSLLGESAGGYVTVAVISFVAAVCITAYLMNRHRNNKPF